MRGLELLEGERVHRVVRTHPLGRLQDYGPGLALLAWAGLLAWLAGSPAGQEAARGLDQGVGAFAVPALLVLWWASLAAATAPFALRRRQAWPLGLAVGLAVVGGFAAIGWTLPDPSAEEASALLPWLTLLGAPVPLLAAEYLRRSRAWAFTNLRLVQREGLLRHHETSWRLLRIERTRGEWRGPRSLDFGDLMIATKDGEVRMPGVKPLSKLRDELELLLHTSPEAPYLGDQRDAAARVERLLRPGKP